ncbi:hypothetical protein ES703_55236 [subsurface metagenome]
MGGSRADLRINVNNRRVGGAPAATLVKAKHHAKGNIAQEGG